MASIYTGLADTYKAQSLKTNPNGLQSDLIIFSGQVLDICLDQTSELYQSVSDIGKIRFRGIGAGSQLTARYEEDVEAIAFPLDRSIVRYPIPGEMVMLYVSSGDVDLATVYGSEKPAPTVYYSLIVAASKNVTYNSNPNFVGDQFTIAQDRVVSQKEAEQRFDNKVRDISSFKQTDNKVKIFKQLKPFEGDFILQGRFGNTIRFGSTSTAADTPWSKPQSRSGVSGDPIMVLRVDRENTVNTADMFTEENVNIDDSSIYLCSSQKIDVSLSCASELKTWGYILGAGGGKEGAGSIGLNPLQGYSEVDSSLSGQAAVFTAKIPV